MTSGSRSRFWLVHAVIPVVAGSAAVVALERSGADRALTDAFFDAELGDFPWRHRWLTEVFVHQVGKQIVIAFGVLLAIGLLASRWKPRLAARRRTMAYLLASLALGPLVTAGWKDLSDKRCPWDLKVYGGFADTDRVLPTDPPKHHRGCFPCGHASGGYALTSLYFAFRDTDRKWARRGLWIGLGYGTVLGIARMAQGAHYASHVVATAVVCWTIALVLYELILRRRASADAATAPSAG
jgi:membrane-associated PAP2 superfamily phosphatase